MSELTKITGGKQPAILTVIADEEVTGTGEPAAMSTLADLVLIIDDVPDRPPYFHNSKYAYRICIVLDRVCPRKNYTHPTGYSHLTVACIN